MVEKDNGIELTEGIANIANTNKISK